MTTQQPVHTSLTKLLGIKTPVVAATMAGVSSTGLAVAVAKAGGFGFISPTPRVTTPAALTDALAAARTALGTPPSARLPLGAGFIGWLLDDDDDGGGGPHSSTTAACLDAALAARVQAVWFSFGVDLGPWVRRARAADPGVLIWVVVNSPAEARRAVDEWAADVLVVQGIEAGGHGRGDAPPLLTLLPLVLRALPTGPGSTRPPLVAAGGLTSGGHVAAALMLGAGGAALGTRFIATHEAGAGPATKAALLGAARTVRTLAYDEVRGTARWPEGVDGRAVVNAVYDDYVEGVPLEERVRRHEEAVKAGDATRAVVWAGASVELVDELKGAGAVVEEIHEELVRELRRAGTMLG